MICECNVPDGALRIPKSTGLLRQRMVVDDPNPTVHALLRAIAVVLECG